MLIIADTSALASGAHTVTFIAKFTDGSTRELTTWNLSIQASTVSSSGSLSTTDTTTKNVIIIAGQSNAYGATPINFSGYNIQQKYANYDFSNIYIHYNNININPNGDGIWKTYFSNSSFEQYRVGIGAEDTSGFGPELGIAVYLSQKYPTEQFYIIKYTAAGTSLNGQWLAPNANGSDIYNLVPTMGGYLSDLMIQYVQSSMAMIGSGAKIQSFVWMQGESDAGLPAIANDYLAYEQNLVNKVRNGLSAYAADGGISFVDVTISERSAWAYATTINGSKRANAQYAYNPDTGIVTKNASANLAHSMLVDKVDWISKQDIGHSADPYHFAPQSMEILGLAAGVAIDLLHGGSAQSEAHTHTEQTVAGKTPTCTESGTSNGIKCSTCGITLVDQYLIPSPGPACDSDADTTCNNGCGYVREDACIHSYDSTAYQKDAGTHWNICSKCNEKVNVTSHAYDNDCDATCNDCGYTRSASHTIVTRPAVTASCLTAGYSESKACGVCGYIAQAPTVTPQLSHEYKATVKAPTCTERGYTTYACQNGCGKSYKIDYKNATGHAYSSSTTAATCSTVGYTTYTCKTCEVSYVGNYVSAKGHSYKTTTVTATCTTRGYTLYECKGCGASYKSNLVTATGHNYQSTTVKATCTTRGYTLYECSSCNSSYKANFVAASGHNYVAVEDANAGVINHTCSGCSMSYTTAMPAARVRKDED